MTKNDRKGDKKNGGQGGGRGDGRGRGGSDGGRRGGRGGRRGGDHQQQGGGNQRGPKNIIQQPNPWSPKARNPNLERLFNESDRVSGGLVGGGAAAAPNICRPQQAADGGGRTDGRNIFNPGTSTSAPPSNSTTSGFGNEKRPASAISAHEHDNNTGFQRELEEKMKAWRTIFECKNLPTDNNSSSSGRRGGDKRVRVNTEIFGDYQIPTVAKTIAQQKWKDLSKAQQDLVKWILDGKMLHIPDELMHRVKSLFELIDSNNDNAIMEDDFDRPDLLPAFRMQSLAAWNELRNFQDIDGDGRITQTEFFIYFVRATLFDGSLNTPITSGVSIGDAVIYMQGQFETYFRHVVESAENFLGCRA